MRKYRLVSKKGEGTFSEVLKAQNVKRGTYHAIKCMRNHFESIDQVNTLREIQALRRLSPHPHIITLEEVLYDQPTGRLALVFELMDQNLYEVIRGRRHYLSPQLIKIYIYQLLKALDHMHRKGIFHRDIKPENILVNHNCDFEKGLKLADFGSCRGIYSKQPYTEYISTRWYRAAECLLTDGYYGAEMDLWGVGCVFFEITSLYPLFPGTNELDQINRIHQILGTPEEKVMQKFKQKGAAHLDFNYPPMKGTGISKLIPHAPSDSINLMNSLLQYDPDERIPAKDALKHPWFHDLHKMEQNMRRRNRGSSSRSAIEGSGSSSPVSKLGSGSSKSLLNDHREKADKESGENSGEKDSGDKSSAKETDGMATGDKDGGEKGKGSSKGSSSSLPIIGASSNSTKGDHAQRDIMRGSNAHAADSMLPVIGVGGSTSTNQDSSGKPENSMSKHGSSTHSSSNLSSKKAYMHGGYGSHAYQSARRKEKKARRKDRKEERRKHRSKKNRSNRSYGSSKKSYGSYGSGSSSYKMQGGSSTRRSQHHPSHSFSVLGQGQGSGTYSYSYGSSKKRSQKYGYPSYGSSIGASPLRKLGM